MTSEATVTGEVFIRHFLGPRPEIVCLCGSTRFRHTFDNLNHQLTMGGSIVLAPGVWVRSSPAFADLPEQQRASTKAALDELHLRKIDLADRVLILNVRGYIGESTRREIRYVQLKRKRIDYLEAP